MNIVEVLKSWEGGVSTIATKRREELNRVHSETVNTGAHKMAAVDLLVGTLQTVLCVFQSAF